MNQIRLLSLGLGLGLFFTSVALAADNNLNAANTGRDISQSATLGLNSPDGASSTFLDPSQQVRIAAAFQSGALNTKGSDTLNGLPVRTPDILVPEPGILSLGALGLCLLGVWRARRAR